MKLFFRTRLRLFRALYRITLLTTQKHRDLARQAFTDGVFEKGRPAKLAGFQPVEANFDADGSTSRFHYQFRFAASRLQAARRLRRRPGHVFGKPTCGIVCHE